MPAALLRENQLPYRGGDLSARVGELLGLPIHSEADAYDVVAEGLAPDAFLRLQQKLPDVVHLVGPATTLRRRLQQGQRFSVAESERLLRLARVAVLAQQVLGEEDAARAWLNQPGDWLPKRPPITPAALATQEAGARMVEATLQRIAHGIY